MSVPRPAMLVAIVMEPDWPASATISASRWWNFAFSTSCFRPRRLVFPGPAQRRPPAFAPPRAPVKGAVVLLAPRCSQGVVFAPPPHRPIGGNDHDGELVDVVEFRFLGLGGARHPGEFLVHPEV